MTLPQGWVEATLGDVCERIVDGSHNPPSGQAAGLPMLSARNVDAGQVHFDQYRLISPIDFEAEDRRTKIRPGTVLLTIVGALGRSAVVRHDQPPFTVQRSVGVLHPSKVITPEFLSRRFDADDAQVWFVENARGTAQKGVYLKTLSGFYFNLPPLAEQHRIVAKLEALTSRLVRARAELDRVLVLAKRLRASTLASAFESAHARSNEGIMADLCLSVTDGDHQAPPKASDGIPFITISAMNGGFIDLAKATRYVPLSYAAGLKEARQPRAGDVLYSVTGSIGIPALVRDDVPFVFQRHIAILRPDPRVCDSEWLAYFLATPQVLAQAEAVATGTAQLTIPLGALRRFKIPMLPLPEQRRQVVELNAAFARADRLEAETVRARALLDRLESALLAKAFRGELVPQDPNDEPAQALLDRIRSERATAPKAKRGRKAKGD